MLSALRTWTVAALAALLALAALAAAATPADAAKRKKTSRTAAACADADLVPSAANLHVVRRATLCLLNRERSRRHRVKLRSSGQLQRAAASYARTMVSEEFFGHVSPEGERLIDRVLDTAYLKGARQWVVGENLAWGTGRLATPRQTVRGWMASPGHKRNVIDKRFRHIGIGIALGAPQPVTGTPTAATYSTKFGRRTASRKTRRR